MLIMLEDYIVVKMMWLLLFILLVLFISNVKADIIMEVSSSGNLVYESEIGTGEISFFVAKPIVSVVTPSAPSSALEDKKVPIEIVKEELCKPPLVYVEIEEGYRCLTKEQLRIRQLTSTLITVFLLASISIFIFYRKQKKEKRKRKKLEENKWRKESSKRPSQE